MSGQIRTNEIIIYVTNRRAAFTDSNRVDIVIQSCIGYLCDRHDMKSFSEALGIVLNVAISSTDSYLYVHRYFMCNLPML